jgi:hypothetical protein
VTISFPRNIPDDLKVVGMTFLPQPMNAVSPLRGGKIITDNLGPTLWKAHYQSPVLSNEAFGNVRAWYDTLLSIERFYGYDKLRQYPIAHKNGWGSLTVDGVPFDGECAIKSVNANTKELTLKDLPVSALRLSTGDYLAFDYGSDDSRALHRVVSGGLSDANGELTIEVRPFIRVGAAGDDPVYLHRPSAEMIILPDSYSETTQLPDLGSISFDAIQAI